MTLPYTFSDCIFGFLRQFPFQKCILLWGLDVKQQKYTKLGKMALFLENHTMLRKWVHLKTRGHTPQSIV